MSCWPIWRTADLNRNCWLTGSEHGTLAVMCRHRRYELIRFISKNIHFLSRDTGSNLGSRLIKASDAQRHRRKQARAVTVW